MWKADPAGSHIVDVRTPEEYIFVGHAPMARNIPLAVHRVPVGRRARTSPRSRPTPSSLSRVRSYYAPTDKLLVMCRSGGRSALAVNALAQAGFTNAYNVIDGFEGDKVADPGSAYLGKRMKNGWKNSGSPWTYECDTELLWIEKTVERTENERGHDMY